MAVVTKVTLRDGNKLPLIGLGTFKLRSSANDNLVHKTIESAVAAGYRLIDTASCYRNEKDIGRSLKILEKSHGLERSELFITSKLAPNDQGYESARKSCLKTLEDLDCKYLDLYLIHWPGKSKLKPEDTKHKEYRMESWRALEELQKDGLIRSIGVSNYTIAHLQHLEIHANILPSVNQVEFHPHLYQKDLLKYCQSKEIQVQAYSSLGTGELVNSDLINEIAAKYNKSESQVLLKWGLQHCVGVIPKSTNPLHIAENMQLFDFKISQEDIKVMDEMNINKHYCWDPTSIP